MANVEKAISFLKAWSPGNPWALVAIHPNGGKVPGRVFRQGQENDMRDWINAHIERFNLYFTVNDVSKNFHKGKAKKKDISYIRGLQVDVDPFNKDLKKEQLRIKRLLEAFPIPPTSILFSGNGLQGFWKLRKPIPVTDETTKLVESYNKKIHKLCGMMKDGTWTLDQIMRLPGTRNLPNLAKRKKGRKASEAKLASFDRNRLYDLSDFEELPDLPAIAEPWLGPLLVAGERPGRDEPYSSRSEASFAAVAEAKKSGLSFEDTRAVLLDPAYSISGHMLDQKDPDRAFERAWGDKRLEGAEPTAEEDLDETIASMNEKFVQSFDGGQHQIMQFTPELADEGPYRFLKPGAFIAMFEGKETIKLGKKSVSVAEYWLSHPQRRMVQSIVFAPGRETPEHYNLWQGWSVQPAETSDTSDWSLFREHVWFNVCGEDYDLYDYYMSWWAHKLQTPDRKIGTALILRGGEGTGKTATAKVFQRILGPHMLKVNDTGQVLGRFNGHHAALLVLHSEESFWAGDKRMEGKLKDIITSDTQNIEFKGKEPKQMPNYYDLYVTGNPDWVVPASLDARRFAVYELGTGRVRDSNFFDAMRKQMWEGKARGCASLMRYLLDYKIIRNLNDVPVTAALVKQKELTMNTFMQFLLEIAELGEIPGSSAQDASRVLTNRLYDEYIARCDKVKEMHGRKNPIHFGRELHRLGVHRVQLGTGARVYQFPDLARYRCIFDGILGKTRKWGKITKWVHSTDYEGDE